MKMVGISVFWYNTTNPTGRNGCWIYAAQNA